MWLHAGCIEGEAACREYRGWGGMQGVQRVGGIQYRGWDSMEGNRVGVAYSHVNKTTPTHRHSQWPRCNWCI